MITDIEKAKEQFVIVTGMIERAMNDAEEHVKRVCKVVNSSLQDTLSSLQRTEPEIPLFDTMGSMLAMQCEFNARLGHVAHAVEGNEARSEWLCKYLLAMRQEIAEATDWLPWKWWSNRTGNKQVEPEDMWSEDHIDELKTELIDIQHFLNCCYLELGMDFMEIHQRYKHKMDVNHQRQNSEWY